MKNSKLNTWVINMQIRYRGLLFMLLFVSFILISPVWAQNKSRNLSAKFKQSKDSVFYPVEAPPMFKEGDQKLIDFINSNLKYPQKAFQEQIEGMVVCSFIVDTTGQILSPKIVRSSNPVFDAEALRLVCLVPPWSPGSLQGKVVRIGYTIPVRFKLPVTIDTLSYSYLNELTQKEQSVIGCNISNKSSENYFTWVASEKIIGVSNEKLIRDYFFKVKGDFSFFQLMVETIDESVLSKTYIGRTFLKKIAPNESFTYQILKDNPDSDLYKDKIVLIKESELYQYMQLEIQEKYLFRFSSIVLTGN